MFSSIQVSLPTSQLQFSRVHQATYTQELYSHDYASITFRDWAKSPKHAKPGSPIEVTISGKVFHGYVHEVHSELSNGKNITKVGVIGASYVMRQSSQKVYRDVSADQVIVDIAKRYKFAYHAIPHPRVYSQLAQAGMTDWEFMVKLAKQCGYSLRAEGAAIYFQPQLKDFQDLIYEARRFVKIEQGIKFKNPLYWFKPLVGETLDHVGAEKYATSVAGIDPYTGQYFKYTQQTRNATTRSVAQPELFDKHDTATVANSYSVAALESQAANDRSTFPYIAEAQVLGDPSLRPGMPVYLDNLGDEYSGYWTILSVEHSITEEQLNAHLHTTIITVGTDALGQVDLAKYPKTTLDQPIRRIVPNVKNTRVGVTTSLKTKGIAILPKKVTGLVDRTNRADTSSSLLSKGGWTSDSGNLRDPIPEKSSSPAIRNKVMSHAFRH